MSTLTQLADPQTTDKGSTHSYLEIYESLFSSRRNTVKRVIEIGVERGGSIKLWAEYFPTAEVVGFDIKLNVTPYNQRVKLFQGNAYNTTLVAQLIQKGIYADVIIDDGPHTLESMVFFVKYYSQLLAPGGVLIVEDIPDPLWVQALYGCVPQHLKPYCKAFDIRKNKGRWDDILFVIDLPVQKKKIDGILYDEIFLEK